MNIKNKTVISFVAVLLAAAPPLATAATTLISGSITTAGSWDNDLPSASNPGLINSSSVGSISALINYGGTTVVDMTGGSVTTGGGTTYNYVGGTFNMSGGLVSARALIANGSTFNLSGGTMSINGASGTKNVQAANGGSINLSGTSILDGTNSTANPNVAGSGTYNFLTGWSGSWTEALMTETPGATWKDYVTTNTSFFKLDSASIDSTIFDANFLVTNGGSTLTLVPEPSSLALLGLGSICFLRRRR